MVKLLFASGTLFIETVDAVSMFMTPQFDTNGLGVDAGGLWTDSSCFILRADSKWNYYFQEDSDNFGKGMLQDPLLSDIAPNVLFNELDDGESVVVDHRWKRWPNGLKKRSLRRE